MLPAAAAAQDWTMPWTDPRDRPARVDVSLSGGYAMPTDWTDRVVLGSTSSATGVFEQVLVPNLRVDAGPVVGAAVSYWKAKYGVRVNVARSAGSLVSAGAAIADVNTWSYDVRGAIGMLDYTPTRIAWPYFFIGLGGVTYDLSRTIAPPLSTFIERQPTTSLDRLAVILRGGREFLLQVDELDLETVPALSIGVGTDFRLPLGPGGVGVRVEVSDQISPSPLEIRLHELSGLGAGESSVPVDFDLVHNLRASAGLVIQFGR
jgi:hypothetical protein